MIKKSFPIIIFFIAFSGVAFAELFGDTNYFIINQNFTQMNMTNVTILNQFDQSLNTSDNTAFNSTKLGDIDQYWINEVLDLTALGLGYLPMLSAKTTSPLGNYGVITNGLYLLGIDTGNIILRFANFTTFNTADLTYHSGTSRFELTKPLDIRGDLTISGVLSGVTDFGVNNVNSQNLNATNSVIVGTNGETSLINRYLNFPIGQAGGVCFGGAGGNNCVLGYANTAGDFFTDAAGGDITFRTNGSAMLFGVTNSQNSQIALTNQSLNVKTNLNISGNIKTTGNYSSQGNQGLTKTITVNNATGTCTIIYTGGIYTGGTC